MRNLKKVLSMVLAVSMMLSMMVFAGAAETKAEAPVADKKIVASDLTDMAKVENKAEVALLVDLGVINGIKAADGTYTYAPTEGINRAAFSKMIYTLLLNKDNADNYKGAVTGLKDVKGHWAEGFIAYCVSTKIAAGDTDKNFKPDEAIKTVTGAKMLLTALGYDATLSKYENDALWSINIMKDAQEAGILDGINLGADDILTRDVAALMIFNALNATNVTPIIDRDQGVAYLSGYKHTVLTLGQKVYGLLKVEATVGAITGSDVTLTAVENADDSATTRAAKAAAVNAAKLSTSGYKFTSEMVGNKVVFYSKNKITVDSLNNITITYKSLVSTTVSSATNTVLATKTNGIDSLKNAITKGHDDFVVALELNADGTKYVVSTFLNGAAKAVVNDAKDAFAPHADVAAAVAKRGVVTEFIDTNSNGRADIIKVTEKKVATITADSSTKVVGDDTQVKVPGVISGFSSSNTTKTVVGYEGLKKDDVVLYVKVGDTTFIEKAVSVNGVVSATKGTGAALKVQIDGTFYSESGLAGKTYAATSFGDFDNTYTFYLDNGKNIVKSVKETTKSVGSYGVLTDIALVASSGTGAKSYVEGVILHTDGTTETVKIASIDGVKVKMTGVDKLEAGLLSGAGTTVNAATSANANPVTQTIYYTVSGTVVTAKYFGAAGTAALTAGSNNILTDSTHASATGTPYAVVGDFYEYTVNSDGNYELKSAANFSDKNGAAVLSNKAIKNGVALFDQGTNIGNNETVFVYSTTDSKGKTTYTTYTGINEAPSTVAAASNQGAKAVVVNAAGVAKFVYVSGVATQAAKTDKVYITSTTQTVGQANGVKYTMQDAIINGEAGKTIKLATGAPVAKGMYKITSVDANGINTIEAVVATSTGVKSSAAGVLVMSSDSWSWDSSTVAYIIDTDKSSTEVSPDAIAKDATDLIFVFGNTTTKLADTIYVVKQSAESTSVTLAAGSPNGATVAGTATDVKGGKGAVTGWATSTADQITVTVADKANTTSTVAINGAAYVSGAAYTIATKAPLTVTVTVTDAFSGATDDYTYTITVA